MKEETYWWRDEMDEPPVVPYTGELTTVSLIRMGIDPVTGEEFSPEEIRTIPTFPGKYKQKHGRLK